MKFKRDFVSIFIVADSKQRLDLLDNAVYATFFFVRIVKLCLEFVYIFWGLEKNIQINNKKISWNIPATFMDMDWT